MKNLLVIILLFSFKSFGQSIYVPSNPDSIKVPVNVNGAVRTVYNIDLTKYRAALSAHDTATALRLLIADKLDKTATITINGTTQTFSSNPSFTVSGGGSSSLIDSSIYVSNYGNDANSGYIKTAPKRTLAAAQILANARITAGASSAQILIEAGSLFKENVTATVNNITYGTYNLNDASTSFANKSVFPILSGADVFNTGWTNVSGNTYSQAITSNIHNFGSYGEMLVIEIDTALEKIQPLSARKYFAVQSSTALVDANPASSYTGSGHEGGTVTLYIHTSNNSNPNNNPKYRYEVTTRNKAIEANASGAAGYLRDNMVFKNLYVRDFGDGYGALAAGANARYERIISQGGTAHSLVASSGFVNNSLFIGGSDNLNFGSIIFYSNGAYNEHNKISNTIFLNNFSEIGAHTSGGSNHAKLEVNNVYVWPNLSVQGPMYFANNTDTVEFNNVYVDGHYQIISSNGTAPITLIKNSLFLNCSVLDNVNPVGIMNIDNFLFKSSPTLASTGIVSATLSTKVTNSIVHIKTTTPIANQYILTNTSGTTVRNNILIGEGVSGVISPAAEKSNIDFDYNIYIKAGAASLLWYTIGGAFNYTFAQWQAATGQDAKSKYIDVSTSPNGLKDVFVDPANGNYTLVAGGWGDSIRTWQTAWGQTAGMKTPPSYFLKRPTLEQAKDMIENGSAPLLSSILSSGSATLPYNITTQGNTFNGANQLVKLDGAGKIPALDGSLITNVSAAPFTSTSSDITFINNTAATSTVQQPSPALILQGQGWKSTATAASQPVSWRAYVLPTGGTTAPSGDLYFQNSVNGGGYTGSSRFTAQGFSTTALTATSGGFSSSISGGNTITSNQTGIGTSTTTDAFIAINNTSATSGSPIQNSPLFRLNGKAYGTNGLSQAADFTMQVRPVNGSNPITSRLVWTSQVNGLGYNDRFSLNSDGSFTYFTTSTEPPTPAAGTVVEWWDGTNKKWKKSDGTTGIIY